MGELFRLIVQRIDLVLLRALRVAAPRAVLLVFPKLILPEFSRFASIPLADTWNPRSCPAETPKEHLVGFSFSFTCRDS
jgi:hypothetical protein